MVGRVTQAAAHQPEVSGLTDRTRNPARVLISLAVPLALLASCATPQTVVKDRIERVNVPVRVGCVTADVPKTPPLNSRYTQKQWDSLTVSQKAAAVSAQGIRRMNESDSLRGATAGCPKA